jgi:hypothetical protein
MALRHLHMGAYCARLSLPLPLTSTALATSFRLSNPLSAKLAWMKEIAETSASASN